MGITRRKGIQASRHPGYRVVHVDTEGGPFVAGGNGMYINTLMANQAKKSSYHNKRIALVVPAYHPIRQSFPKENKEKIIFSADIYTPEGKKEAVEITAWKESKDNTDYFYLEPDKNHKDYFMTRADDQGKIFGIRTIPVELTPIQNENKELIKKLEKQFFHEKDHVFYKTRKKILQGTFAAIKKDDLNRYIESRVALQTAYDKLQTVFEGRTNEISLYMRNAHYHEISGAFIDHLLEAHSIDVLHTHDYGNTARYISKKVAKVNTFHSDPGQGVLPYYIQEKLGVDATQRGDGLVNHHMVYAVSEPYAQWLEKPQYSNSHYTGPMAVRGRTACVTSIADTSLHGLHKMQAQIFGYCSDEEFKRMEVYQKKQLAKNILADKLKELNPNFDFDPAKKTLLFLSRISPAKGSDFIEDAIQFADKNNCNVIICGFHGFEGSEKLIKELRQTYPGVPIIIGKEDQAKLGCLHRAASDIGVGVSLEEAFGLSYSECLLYGSMCVISDVGGSRNAVLNKNLCGVVFPLFKGRHERYTQLQKSLCDIKNNLQEIEEQNLSREAVGSLKEKKAEIEHEIYRYFILDMPKIKKELAKRRNDLITYLSLLNERIGSDPLYDTLGDLEEISRLEKDLQEIDNRVNDVNKLDKLRTAEALVEGLEKALKIISAAPEMANYIYDTAQKAFSPKTWTENIEAIYGFAETMHQSSQILCSEDFKQSLFIKSKQHCEKEVSIKAAIEPCSYLPRI